MIFGSIQWIQVWTESNRSNHVKHCFATDLYLNELKWAGCDYTYENILKITALVLVIISVTQRESETWWSIDDAMAEMTLMPCERGHAGGRRKHKALPCPIPPPRPPAPSCHPRIPALRRRQMVAMATGSAVGRVAVVSREWACCLSQCFFFHPFPACLPSRSGTGASMRDLKSGRRESVQIYHPLRVTAGSDRANRAAS